VTCLALDTQSAVKAGTLTRLYNGKKAAVNASGGLGAMEKAFFLKINVDNLPELD
jgi:hypothetical protein